MATSTKVGHQIIEGFRAGVRIHTKAGYFVNGSIPSPEVARELKGLGYVLRSAKSEETAAASEVSLTVTPGRDSVESPALLESA